MIKTVLLATGDFGLPIFESIRLDHEFDIVSVVTHPVFEMEWEIKTWAEINKLPLLMIDNLKNEATIKKIKNLNADLYLVVDFGMIIPEKLLNEKWLNIHGSLLPKYRGASPIQAAIFNGEKKTGTTLMIIERGLDTGPIISQSELEINDQITLPELREKLSKLARNHLRDIKMYLSGQKTAIKQDDRIATIAKKLLKTDGQCKWQSSITECRRVRAYNPWPGAWSIRNNKTVKFLSARYKNLTTNDKIGTIVKISEDPGWAVVCQDGLFIPTIVQAEGKKPQPAKTFPGSYPNFIGSNFSS